jgi:uncharacterized membrane protein YraQ (UPF0718 family)
MTEAAARFVWETWVVLGEMSPYLLFGFLMAGVLSVCVSPEFVDRHLGGRGFGPVWKAAVFGVPLPLCSCSVIPVAAGFRRHGASRAAVTAFLLSTPQTGVDSILVTYSLLGGVFAVFRPVAALITGLFGGLLVMLFAPADAESPAGEPPQVAHCDRCCCQETKHGALRRIFEYGFLTLPRDIGVPLLVGALIAGACSAFISPNEWKPYLGGGILSIVMMMALGVPVYVCASASVPIAVALIHLGASPGAVFAFLVTGPATNAATITTVWKFLGGRTVLLYLFTVAASAVAGGMLLDALWPNLQIAASQSPNHCHDAMSSAWILSSWAALLLLALGVSYAANLPPAASPGAEK